MVERARGSLTSVPSLICCAFQAEGPDVWMSDGHGRAEAISTPPPREMSIYLSAISMRKNSL